MKEITEFTTITESEAQKLKKISLARTYHDGSVFFVATEKRTRWRFNVCRLNTVKFNALTSEKVPVSR